MKLSSRLFPILLFLAFGSEQLAQAQSSCKPVLTYNTDHNLCANSDMDLILTVSVGLPPGCVYSNSITPFNWIGPNGAGLKDENYTTISSPIEGDYYVEIDVDQSTVPGSPICQCTGNNKSNVIKVRKPPVMPNVISNIVVCGGSTVLKATIPAGPAVGYFNWYDSADNLLYSGNNYDTGILNETKLYKLTYVENGCESAERTFSVIVDTLPTPDVNGTSIYCHNSATLSGVSVQGGVLYWYADGNGRIDYNNLLHIGNEFNTAILEETTPYWVLNAKGECRSPADDVTVTVNTASPPMVTHRQGFAGEEVILTAVNTSGGSGYFEWTDSSGSLRYFGDYYSLPDTVINNPGIYTLSVVNNIDGCKSEPVEQRVTIKTKEGSEVIVYELLTLNGDEFNNYWHIKFLNILNNYKIYVFDRQNQLIFYHDYQAQGSYADNMWDGRFKGKFVPTGTYRYAITTEDKLITSGGLTILTND